MNAATETAAVRQRAAGVSPGPAERQLGRAAGLLAAWRGVVRAWPGGRWHTLGWAGAAGGGSSPPAWSSKKSLRWPLVHLALPGGPARALLVAGLHGDEPSGPDALWRFFASGAAATLAAQWSFDVLPLANPSGYDHGTRGSAHCEDPNRMFADPAACPEAAAILHLVAHRFAAGRQDPTEVTGTRRTAGVRRVKDAVTAVTAVTVGRAPLRTPGEAPRPAWDLVLSLHEDTEARCLYLYDSGCRDRHQFAAALARSVAFLDWAEQQGVAVCTEPFLDDDPNHGGVLIGAQTPFPALEPTLFRTGVAGRVVIIEAPGLLPAALREQVHLAALRHFLGRGEWNQPLPAFSQYWPREGDRPGSDQA